MVTKEITVLTRTPHRKQAEFIDSKAKRRVIRAGRRGGKTVGIAITAIDNFIDGKRVLYTAPTGEQTDRFWHEIVASLSPLLRTPLYKKDETERYIEKVGTENRIKAKTAWNANTLRGDYGDLLIFDEYQLMDEDAWEVVGVPMLLDNNGNAVFIYTPPSLRSSGVSKARDPRHASKMFKRALEDTTGRWEAFHFTSHDNPHISKDALREIIGDMSKKSYRQEILAEDDEIEDSWLVWGAFNEAVCKIPRFEIPKTWHIHTAHDFGTANPAALFIADVTLPLPPGAPPYMRYRDKVIFKEYLPGGGYSTAHHVDQFKDITRGYHVESSTGGSHQEDEIRQGYTAHGWHISAPKLKNVKPQIDKVTGMMELNKVYVLEDCLGLLEEFYNCLWKLDKEGRTTEVIDNEARYHLSACLRYKLSDFLPETVQGNRPQTKVHIRL